MGFAVTSYADGAVGILSASIISLDQGLNTPDSETALQVDKDRYAMFFSPAKTIDTKTLDDFVDPINAKKADVLTNGSFSVWQSNEKLYNDTSSANSALNTLYGDVTTTEGLYSQKQIIEVLEWTGTPGSGIFGQPGYVAPNPTASITVSAGASVTSDDTVGSGATGILLVGATITAGVSGRIIVENVDGDFETGADEITVGAGITIITNVTSVKYFGEAELYQDILTTYRYPNMEPPDSGQEDIFANPKVQIVEATPSDNRGLGVANTFFQNGLNTTTSAPTPTLNNFVPVEGSVPFIGKVYTFDTSAASSNASTIDTKRSEIQTLRQGTGSPSTAVVDFAGAGSIVKEQKQSYAVNVWSGERMKIVMGDEKTSLETAISVLTNPDFQ